MRYECTLPYLSSHDVSIYFRILLQERSSIVTEVKNNSAQLKIEISGTFDGILLKKGISRNIFRWTRGAKAEYLFEEKILKPLLNLPCQRVVQAYHVGNRKDSTTGVDFIISFLDKPDMSIETVSFNLKSSDKYLDKHIKKYPTVSTFKFAPWHLQNITKTRKNFLHFIRSAQQDVCYH